MKQSVLLAILLSICPAAWSATYYVSAAGSNVPPFADWGNAATNLADAAAYANLDPTGGTVLVTAGVYNIDATIALTNARLRGFSGLPGMSWRPAMDRCAAFT